MKQSISYLMTLFVFYSCSLGKVKPGNIENYDDINNEDFVRKKSVAYNKKNDRFPSIPGHVFGSETLLYLKKLPKQMKKDAFIEFSYQCQKGVDFIPRIKKLYEEYKEHPAFWNTLGTCYFVRGQHTYAEMYFRRSLSLDRSYFPALNNIGVLYTHQNKKGKALAAIKKSIDLSRNAIIPRLNLVAIYLQFYQLDLASDQLNKLTRAYPNEQRLLELNDYLSLLEQRRRK